MTPSIGSGLDLGAIERDWDHRIEYGPGGLDGGLTEKRDGGWFNFQDVENWKVPALIAEVKSLRTSLSSALKRAEEAKAARATADELLIFIRDNLSVPSADLRAAIGAYLVAAPSTGAERKAP